MIHVECPDCSKSYDVADELAGKAAKCRACGGRIPIPQLASDSDTPAERTKPAQLKPAPTKTPSPKATIAPPAKSKPTVKPKSAPKKHEDDFFEDDFQAIDGVEDSDSSDDFEAYTSSPRRTAAKKKSQKKRMKISFNWLGWIGGLLTKDIAGLCLLLFGISIFVLMVTVVGPPQRFGVNQQPWVVYLAGLVLIGVGNLWLTVRIWRINAQWAAIFLGSEVALRAMAKVVPIEIVYGLEGIRGVALIAFVVDNWKDVKAPFMTFILGLCLYVAAAIGVVPIGNPVAQGDANPAGPANAPIQRPSPSVPSIVGNNGPVAPNVAIEKNAPNAEAKNVAPFPLGTVPIADLPEFSLGGGGRGESFSDTSVTCMRLFFISAKSNSQLIATVPGVNTKMIYFEPKGVHDAKSLPCILVASAGSNLLQGADCPSKDYLSETIPYVKAGFAVLGFSLDGHITQQDGRPDEQVLRLNFSQFQRAQAGLVNVRNVVEFASHKIPQVDPDRLFIAGHSSAATLALLAAAHEPRLKAAVAYAPATDVESRQKDALAAPDAEKVLPGVRRFAKQSSPINHIERIGCPIFLFHASDDSNVAVGESRRFALLLQTNKKQVDYVEVASGDHYDSMIQQGIPRAIVWLKGLAAKTTPSKSNAANAINSANIPATVNSAPPDVNRALQPTGRAVTFKFQSFSGKGDPAAAARQALKSVYWADLNDIVIDQATSEIRIGQLGGSVNSDPARQALVAAGFQLIGGVSIGAKKSTPPTRAEPARTANSEPSTPVTSTPPATESSPKSAASKPATPSTSEPAAPKESGPPRQVVTFRYDRYTGKGSSKNAAAAALKKIKWADPNDIELDAAKHEIRVGQLEESKEYAAAEKSLRDAGFSLTPGVTSGLRKR